MVVYIGSSRHDENGRYKGGKAGDQKQKINTSIGLDISGEVSAQTLNSFIGSKAWYLIRPKRADHAQAIAAAMEVACNNKNLGYDQNQRVGIVLYGVDSSQPTECDCSSTIRACIKKATGVDVGNFTTSNEKTVLENAKLNGTALFDKAIVYRHGTTKVYEGDILVTQTKGHTGACVRGYSRDVQSGFIYQGVDYSLVFNPVYYGNKHPDVKADKTYGKNNTTLFQHFCQHGMKEARQACLTFNPLIYMERYPELKEKFGKDYPKYYAHYCIFGKAEGRTGI